MNASSPGNEELSPLPQSGIYKKKFILLIGAISLFSLLFFLFFIPGIKEASLKGLFIELTFIWLLFISVPLNRYVSGTGTIIFSFLFILFLTLHSVFFLKWNLFLSILFYILVQALDRYQKNGQTSLYQHSVLKIEEIREKTFDLRQKLNTHKDRKEILQNQLERFSELRAYLSEINLSLSPEHLADMILKFTSENLTTADIYSLSLLDAKNHLRTASFMVRENTKDILFRPDQADIFNNWVLSYRTPLTVRNTTEDFRFQGSAHIELLYPQSRSIIACPLISDDKPLGLLRLDSKQVDHFTQSDFRFLVIIANISALSLKNAELFKETQKLSITDGLTGFYIQSYFYQKLEELIQEDYNQKSGHQISLIMMDLDHFKKVNDTLGHIMGDRLLVRTTKIIRKHCPKKSGHPIRYGGEEFILLLNHYSKHRAQQVAERIKASFNEKDITIGRTSIPMTISMGIATYPEDAKDSKNLVAIADRRLYLAKEQGRNRIVSTP